MDRTFSRVMVAIVAVLALLVVGACGFLGGVVADRASTPNVATSIPLPGATGSTDLGKLMDQVQTLVKANALQPSSQASMTTNAVKGLLNSLGDPYAYYFDPQAYTRFNQDNTGEFFGIGITVQLNPQGQPMVAQPFPGTPAGRAGLKSGDVIVSINGEKHPKWDIDEVVKRIRGPKGTTVTLQIQRKGVAKPFKVTLTRDKITVPNVMTKMVRPGLGYIRLMQFNEQAAQQVRDAITKLDKQGAKGYILDLRENPGGLLSQAVDVSSLFIKDGVIVRVDERGKPEEELRATGETATNKPLVLLVDANSASAAEIVSAALQDYGRAVLVGVKTYGKGSVQTVLNLANGGAIKVTTAHYLSPKKRVINKKGVTPNIIVVMDPKNQAKASTDTQLARAIAELQTLLAK